VALPDSQITVWLQRDNDQAKSYTLKSDAEGDFVFIAEDKLKEGAYKMWAESIAPNGAKGETSEKAVFKVVLPMKIRFGNFVVDYITVVNTLLTLCLGLFLLVFYAWHRIAIWKRRVRQETREAEQKLKSAFLALTKEVKAQTAKMDGVEGLSEREKNLYLRLKKALDSSEKIIEKEISQIEKAIKHPFLRSLIFWKKKP